MKTRSKKLGVILVLAILISPLVHLHVSIAQGPDSVGGEFKTGVSFPISPSATIQKEINITLSAGDLAIWSNCSHNVYGDWTWTLPSDAEILDIDFIGDSYTVEGNKIYFYGLDGYVKVVYRTSSGIQRDGRYLIFSSGWSVSEPFDLDAQITFPEFYSDYIVSITPPGYIQSPGSISWHLTDTEEWSFHVQFDLNVEIVATMFPDGNKTAHHTRRWPSYAFRRVQWVSARVEFEGTFNPETDSLRWSIKGPNQDHFTEIPVWTPSLSDTSWAVREGDLIGQSRTDEIFIPAEAAVGLYTLKVAAYRNTGEGSIFQDSETTPDFYVIFNPWNDDDDPRYDEDVYNPSFNNAELSWYGESGMGKNYYPDGNSTVDWLLSPFDESVFMPVINEVAGVNSAHTAVQRLVDKTRWDDGTPTDSEILEGRWGWGFYKVNWRDVPAIMAAWDNGNNHPTGQCMDFGGLVSAFARAVGVPVRMLTCVNCADGHGGVWNFHVWNEVWVNEVSSTTWSPADGTYGIGPTTRQDSFIQEEVSTSTGIYTYDARTGGKVNILSGYRPPLGTDLQPTEVAESLQAIALTVGTDQLVYNFGDTVTILVTATNSSASDFSGDLQTSVSLVDYSGPHEFHTYPARNVTVPAGGTAVETYVLPQTDYEWNGDFLVSATLDTASGESQFSVEDGLDSQLTTPNEVVVGDSLNVSFRVTNTLLAPIYNLDVEIYFPPSVSGVANPTYLSIPGLAAGNAYATSWMVSVSEPGLQPVMAYASSADAGYDQAYDSFNALGNASLAVLVEVPNSVTPGTAFNATARVRNEGSLTATNVQVVLSVSGGLSSTDPLTVSVGNLGASEEQAVIWSITASEAGVHTLQVNATETSTGDEELANQLVVAVQEPHSIALTASQQTVAGLDPVTITLTLANMGDVQDNILLDVVSDNPNIGFTVYDDSTPLEGSVIVPAHGSRDLSLVIRPHQWEDGLVSVKAVSEMDPNAVDYLVITVSERPFGIFLPIVVRSYSAGTTYNWLDATSGGTIVADGDDTYEYVSLPFSFNFYGNTYNGLYVSSNGFVSFGSGYTTYSNSCIPSTSTPNNAIYAFWDDLVPTGGSNGNIYVKQIDSGTFAIEWYQVRRYGSYDYETFEIVLRSDHSITLQYQSVSNTGSATVGIENATGTLAQQYICNGVGTPLTNQLAIRYTTP